MSFKSESGYPMSHYMSQESRLQTMVKDLIEDRRRDNRRIKAGLTLATWCDICFENGMREGDVYNMRRSMNEFFEIMEQTGE